MKVTFEVVDSVSRLKEVLAEFDAEPVIACDFEAALKREIGYLKELEKVYEAISKDLNYTKTAAILQRVVNMNAFMHPDQLLLTHISLAHSENQAVVVPLLNPALLQPILDFLVTTKAKQAWHNALYDFKFIMSKTGKIPQNFIDTFLLTKALTNSTRTKMASLKHLMGKKYGDWGSVKDNTDLGNEGAEDFFTLKNLYDPLFLEYAAIDACATFALYNRLKEGVA